jgi:hypothetical protein
MFNKKANQQGFNQRFGQGPMPQGNFNPYQQKDQYYQNPYSKNQFPNQQPTIDPNLSSLYPNSQYERLQIEIRENRRRINNLQKRVIRLENYLRIRDTSDYIEEDQIPNEFSL